MIDAGGAAFKPSGKDEHGNGTRRTDAPLANQLESSRGEPQAWTPGSLSAIHKAFAVKRSEAEKTLKTGCGWRRDRRRLHRGRKTTMHDTDDTTRRVA
jgi:hypothetical protein